MPNDLTAQFALLDDCLLRLEDGTMDIGELPCSEMTGPLIFELFAFLPKYRERPSVEKVVRAHPLLEYLAYRREPGRTEISDATRFLFRAPLRASSTRLETSFHGAVLEAGKLIKRAGISTNGQQGLRGCLQELLGNVLEHSGRPATARLGIGFSHRTLWFSVADCGQGMLTSYQSRGWSDVRDAGDALQLAVLEHRSSTRDPTKGLGFAEIVRSMRALGGLIRVRTGDAGLVGHIDRWTIEQKAHLTGVVVTALIALQGQG